MKRKSIRSLSFLWLMAAVFLTSSCSIIPGQSSPASSSDFSASDLPEDSSSPESTGVQSTTSSSLHHELYLDLGGKTEMDEGDSSLLSTLFDGNPIVPDRYLSSDESVAIVEDGAVKALKAGTAVISAYYEFEGEIYTASATIVVNRVYRVNDVSFDVDAIECSVGDVIDLRSHLVIDGDGDAPIRFQMQSGEGETYSFGKGTNRFTPTSRGDFTIIATYDDYENTVGPAIMYIYASDEYSAGIDYSKVEGGYSARNYLGSSEVVYIPPTYRGEPVVDVELYGDTAIRELVLPSSVKSVTRVNAPNLEKINLDEVTELGRSAFYCCEKLEDVGSLAKIDRIPDDCFRGCLLLRPVELSPTLISIGAYAFSFSEFTFASDIPVWKRFVLPSSIETIGKRAFAYGAEVYLPFASDLPGFADGWSERANVFYSGSSPVEDDDGFTFAVVTGEESTYAVVTGYSGKEQEVRIPSEIEHLGAMVPVRSIAPFAFHDNAVIRSLWIPGSIDSYLPSCLEGNDFERVVFDCPFPEVVFSSIFYGSSLAQYFSDDFFISTPIYTTHELPESAYQGWTNWSYIIPNYVGDYRIVDGIEYGLIKEADGRCYYSATTIRDLDLVNVVVASSIMVDGETKPVEAVEGPILIYGDEDQTLTLSEGIKRAGGPLGGYPGFGCIEFSSTIETISLDNCLWAFPFSKQTALDKGLFESSSLSRQLAAFDYAGWHGYIDDFFYATYYDENGEIAVNLLDWKYDYNSFVDDQNPFWESTIVTPPSSIEVDGCSLPVTRIGFNAFFRMHGDLDAMENELTAHRVVLFPTTIKECQLQYECLFDVLLFAGERPDFVLDDGVYPVAVTDFATGTVFYDNGFYFGLRECDDEYTAALLGIDEEVLIDMPVDGIYERILNLPRTVVYNGTEYPVTRLDSRFADPNLIGALRIGYVFIPESYENVTYETFKGAYCLFEKRLPIEGVVASGLAYRCEQYGYGLGFVLRDDGLYSVRFNGSGGLFATIVKYFAHGPVASMPGEIEAFGQMVPVTRIGREVLRFSEVSIDSISIPSSVMVIEEEAFAYCQKVRSITGFNGTRIEDEAFVICSSLEYIELGSRLEYIGFAAFQCAGEDSATGYMRLRLPYSLTEIDQSAFYGAHFDYAYLNANIKTIGAFAFSNSQGEVLVETEEPNDGWDDWTALHDARLGVSREEYERLIA